eukprot:5464722-Amphidinium_carterae.1
MPGNGTINPQKCILLTQKRSLVFFRSWGSGRIRCHCNWALWSQATTIGLDLNSGSTSLEIGINTENST